MAITTIVMDVYKPGSELKNKVVDISDSFNARVGDNQVRLVIKYIERGIVERMEQEQLTPFMTGYVGQPDEELKVTAETGTVVSYHGSSNDIIGGGKVKLDLPGAMFPQEGAFYGYFGLENSEGKRVTTNNVFFRVENNNPDIYVDTLPFRTELQKLLDWATAQANSTFGDIKKQWEDLVKIIKQQIATGNDNIDDFLNRLKLAQEKLEGYEKQITDGNIPTQADLDKALNPIDDRLDKLEAKEESSDLLTDVGGGIRDIFTSQISNMKARINPDLVNIGMINDVHYTDRDSFWGPDNDAETGITHLLNMGEVSEKLDFAVSVGDNTDDNNGDNHFSIKRIEDYGMTWFTALECPSAVLLGNHDDNSSHAKSSGVTGNDYLVPDSKFIQAYRQNVNLFGEKRNGNSNYFYYDIPDKKVRVVGINDYENPNTLDSNGNLKYPRINTSVITGAQLKWLASDALNVSADTHVIVMLHCPIDGTLKDNPTDHCYNHDLLRQLLEAFKNGTSGTLTSSTTDFPVDVDYSFTSKGTLIGVFAGHTHTEDYQVINGINYVLNLNSVGCAGNAGNRTLYFDTKDEDSWSVIGIDPANKKVKLTKFGRGTDLDFTY
ncbi:metallophosphoesterase family protein [Pediococcus pentosaceus]|uniref:metallophosphoesterase family protein n=1 Tax=Pediococcus pentosaceus TaxID=1255 RepID=UPI001C7DCDF7|nr:metallophosphoesterase [Pediococcus pentosaceus]QYY85684.1 capsid protein [Pediococcus pentosaceus]